MDKNKQITKFNFEKVVRLIGIALLLYLLVIRFQIDPAASLSPWPWIKVALDSSRLQGMSLEERAIELVPGRVQVGLMVRDLTPPDAIILIDPPTIDRTVLRALAYPRKFYYVQSRLTSRLIKQQVLPPDAPVYLLLSRDLGGSFHAIVADDIVVKADQLEREWALLTLAPGVSMQDVQPFVTGIKSPPGPEVLLESFTDPHAIENWSPMSSNNVKEGVFEIEDGLLKMSYENDPGQRDIFDYFFRLPQLMSMIQLKLRVYITPGTLLTISTIEDGERVPSSLEYYPGTGEWEEITIPVYGLLDTIIVRTRERDKRADTQHYELQIDWIKAVVVNSETE